MGLHWVDIVFLVLLTGSVLLGFLRGFIKEILTIASWLFAAWIAYHFSKTLTIYFVSSPTQGWQWLIGSGIFIACVMIGAILNVKISHAAHHAGLNGVDRGLGALFGVARALIAMSMLLWLALLWDVLDSKTIHSTLSYQKLKPLVIIYHDYWAEE